MSAGLMLILTDSDTHISNNEVQQQFLSKCTVFGMDTSSDDCIMTWKLSPVSAVFFDGYNPGDA